MITDAQNQFSNAQAVTATAVSTNYIDLSQFRDIGTGENLYIGVNVAVAMTDAGSDSTITVTLESDEDTAFSDPNVAQTLGTFAALSAIGTRIIARIQPGVILLGEDRYIQLRYTAANGNLTTGSFTAEIFEDIDKFQSYASGFAIS